MNSFVQKNFGLSKFNFKILNSLKGICIILFILFIFAYLFIFQIVDLRRELEDRNLSSKGLKSQLIARLTKVLKTEKEEEEEQESNKVAAVRCL